MPRVHRVRKRRAAGYTREDIDELLTGCRLHGRSLTADELQAAWEALRGRLLAEWIAENPGARPYAWWAVDAPERRPRIGTRRWLIPAKDVNHRTPDPWFEFIPDDGPHPFDNPLRKAEIAAMDAEAECDDAMGLGLDPYRLGFGVPNVSLVYDRRESDPLHLPGDFGVAYETEPAYLDRLGLLTDEERSVLTPDDLRLDNPDAKGE